jgi:hypothetical protein
VARPKKKRVEVIKPPTDEEDEMFETLYRAQQTTYSRLLEHNRDEEDSYLMAARNMMAQAAQASGNSIPFLSHRTFFPLTADEDKEDIDGKN